MATICPTVLADNPHQFREQIERVAAFATNIHLDFADGEFTNTKTIALSQAWWPHTMQADLHVMYQNPAENLDELIPLNPRMVIIHAEANGSITSIANALHQAGIDFGVALLPDTPVKKIAEHLEVIDHVLLFGGNLGHFGGQANLALLDKVAEVKKLKKSVTIGWDGGVNADNALKLVEAGVDVLDVGGFIQHAEDPQAAYKQLQKLLQ